MRICIAGKYSRRVELLAYAARLEALGHTVTSRWLRFAGENIDGALTQPENRDAAQQFALQDEADVLEADLFLAFTEEPYISASRGTRHWEAGIARHSGKAIWVVGPVENIAYTLPGIKHFTDFNAAFQALLPQYSAVGSALGTIYIQEVHI